MKPSSPRMNLSLLPLMNAYDFLNDVYVFGKRKALKRL